MRICHRFLGVPLAGMLLSLGAAGPADALGVDLRTSIDPLALTVGGLVTLDVALAPAGDPIAPGTFSFRLELAPGARDDPTTALAALILQGMPSPLDAGSLAVGPDCVASVGQPSGECSFDVTAGEPIDSRLEVARLAVVYDWIPAPGFELCSLSEPGQPGDPGCTTMANEGFIFRAHVEDQSGDRSATTTLFGGTLAGVGVRPIPEPSTALLLGLGLATLARRPTPRRCSPPRP